MCCYVRVLIGCKTHSVCFPYFVFTLTKPENTQLSSFKPQICKYAFPPLAHTVIQPGKLWVTQWAGKWMMLFWFPASALLLQTLGLIDTVLWLCPPPPTPNYEPLKWLSSLPIIMQNHAGGGTEVLGTVKIIIPLRDLGHTRTFPRTLGVTNKQLNIHSDLVTLQAVFFVAIWGGLDDAFKHLKHTDWTCNASCSLSCCG